MRHLLGSFLVLLALALPAGAASLPPGVPLDRGMVADLVTAELVPQGSGQHFEVTIDGPALPLPNRASRPAELRLDAPLWDQRSGRFSADLHVTLPAGETAVIAVWGRAVQMVEAAVPARMIRRGETIAAADLERRWVAMSQLPSDPVLDDAAVAGSEAARFLMVGRIVRAADLVRPRQVRRGEPVTVIYAQDGLALSAAGEALDDAGDGEPVRVLNTTSRAIRRGIAVGPRQVQVSLAQEPGR